MVIYILTATLIVLQALDIYTTLEAFKVGATEGNPFMSKIMERLGVVPALISTKIFASAILVGVSWLVLQSNPFVQIVWIVVLFGLICFYVKVVINNWEISGEN